MPLYDKKIPKPMDTSTKRHTTEYQDVQSDTRYESYRDLTMYIEGSTWVVDLYSRVVNKDTENTSYDRSLHASLQSYRHIRGYELKVTQGLQKEFNSDKNKFTVTGAANAYPGLVLNPGDNFIAEIGEGKLGHFNIKEVTPKTIYKETSYSITYVMIDVVDDTYLRELNKKVVETLVFVRDSVRYGCNPIYALDDYRLRDTCIKAYQGLSNYYIREFFYNQESTICLGDSNRNNVYDPFVVKFFLSIMDSSENNQVQRIHKHVVNTAYDKNILTVFDALLDRDVWKLSTADDKMSIIGHKLFRNHQPYAGGIAYSKLNKVVYPSRYNPQYHLREGHIDVHRDLDKQNPKLDKPYVPNNYVPDESLTGVGELCPIYPDYEHPKSLLDQVAEEEEKNKNKPTHDESGNFINRVKKPINELIKKGKFPFTDQYIEYLKSDMQVLGMEDERFSGMTPLGVLNREKEKAKTEVPPVDSVDSFLNNIPLFNSDVRGENESTPQDIHVSNQEREEPSNHEAEEESSDSSEQNVKEYNLGHVEAFTLNGPDNRIIRFDYTPPKDIINAIPYNPEHPVEGSVFIGEDGKMRIFRAANLVGTPPIIPERGLIAPTYAEEFDYKRVRICECESCQTGGWGLDTQIGDENENADDSNDKYFAGFGNLVPYAVPEEFYTDVDRSSPELLRLLNAYMRDEKIDYDSILKVATAVMKTTRRKKFYCIPLIMMLLIHVIGDYRFTR